MVSDHTSIGGIKFSIEMDDGMDACTILEYFQRNGVPKYHQMVDFSMTYTFSRKFCSLPISLTRVFIVKNQ
jgi:hypothetical protein